MEIMDGTVENIMSKLLLSVDASAKIGTVSKLMSRSNADILPVLEDGRLVGIINEDSLNPNSSDSVRKLMRKPLFVEKNRNVDYCIKYILKHGISRVPVVDSAIGMKCIGTVSSSQLLKAKKLEKK